MGKSTLHPQPNNEHRLALNGRELKDFAQEICDELGRVTAPSVSEAIPGYARSNPHYTVVHAGTYGSSALLCIKSLVFLQ